MTTPRPASALDEADVRILAALQQDASIANQDLAALVHLSPAPCLRRVRRLREQGYIQGIVALVDRDKLGLEVAAYAFVTLDSHRAGAGAVPHLGGRVEPVGGGGGGGGYPFERQGDALQRLGGRVAVFHSG